MEMKHQDGHKPSAEETAKLNEFVSWLVDNGYHGIVIIHKGDAAISWLCAENADEIRHALLNSVSHNYQESEKAALDFAGGICMAAKRLTED